MKEVAILLRFDTEDFLTPESDDAALAIADLCTRVGARATFPVTAWKARALAARDRSDVISALSRHDVGFHSTSHSLHPTIAEDLEATPDDRAAAAFAAREGDGMREVEATFGRSLACYTQPGANWVAEASDALSRWGIPLHYGEGWNAYIDVAGRPFRLGTTLHYSGAVACPKPFLSRLPESLALALTRVDAAVGEAREGPGDVGLVNVVAHPTELVTKVFWDAVNFGGGANRDPMAWRPPPVRAAADAASALGALGTYLRHLQALPGAMFWGASDLARAHPDTTEDASFDLADAVRVAEAFAGGRIGAIAVRGAILSPAQAVTLLARAAVAVADGTARAPIRVGLPLPSYVAEPHLKERTAEGPTLLEAARALAGASPWPVAMAGLPMTAAAGALARLLLAELADARLPAAVAVPEGQLLTRRWVRPEGDLHWDWPIFRPGFRAPRLRERALRATWTLKPTETALCEF